jgi:hypothetical protein
MANPLDRFALVGRDIERASSTNCHAPNIRPDFDTFRHHRFDHIPCLETLDHFGLLRASAWEATLVHQAHLSASVSIGSDEQCRDPLDRQVFRGASTYTGSIKPVSFL